MNPTHREGYRWVILGTLFSVHVLTAVGQFSIPPLLPFIKKELGLSYTQVGVFTSSYYLGIALAATFAGWAADSMGVKKIVVLATIMVAISTFVASWMPSLGGIMFFMVLAGISYSVLTPSTSKATMYWFHERLRATAMGIKQTGINGGGFLAAFIIPPLALYFDWRYALTAAAFLVLSGGIVMGIFYREFDLSSSRHASLAKCGTQMKAVILNRNVLILGVEGFFRVGVQTAFLTYLILYLQKTLQLSVLATGSFFALAHGSGALGRIIWGLVSDRIFEGRRKKIYMTIGLVSGLFFIVFGHLTPATPIWAVTLMVLILGFTAAGHQGVGLSLLAEVAGKECTGRASGFTQSFCFCGVVLMAPLFGFLVDAFETYLYAWLAIGFFSFIASGLVLLVKEEFKGAYAEVSWEKVSLNKKTIAADPAGHEEI